MTRLQRDLEELTHEELLTVAERQDSDLREMQRLAEDLLCGLYELEEPRQQLTTLLAKLDYFLHGIRPAAAQQQTTEVKQ